MPADLWCYKIDSLSCCPCGAIVSFSSEQVITAHVMHATVFLQIKASDWFNIPAHVFSVNPSVLPPPPVEKRLFTLKKKNYNETAHISHPVVYVVCRCLTQRVS